MVGVTSLRVCVCVCGWRGVRCVFVCAGGAPRVRASVCVCGDSESKLKSKSPFVCLCGWAFLFTMAFAAVALRFSAARLRDQIGSNRSIEVHSLVGRSSRFKHFADLASRSFAK